MRGDLRLFSPLILRLFDFVAGFHKSPCSRGSRTGARAAAACLHAGSGSICDWDRGGARICLIFHFFSRPEGA